MLFAIFFWTATGSICAYLAGKNKKNPIIWFLIGMFFGLIGVFAAFYKFKYKSKKELLKLQQKNVAKANTLPQEADKLWFYLDGDNNASTSMSAYALRKKIEEGVVSKISYVWNEEMPTWQRVSELPAEITNWLLPRRE